jgi:TetR/AcrR family transcriptional repressor of nem operon
MRYSATHKTHTRARILATASQAFRERGVVATGVDEVMRRAGLTHGGFYAHFRNKSDLVAAACAAGFESAVENLDRIARLPTVRARVRALVGSYLGSRHRDNPAAGCLVAALGAEASRLDDESRAAYSQAFQSHRRRVAEAVRLSPHVVENTRRVTALLSFLVGALLVARSVRESSVSDQILAEARETALVLFADPTIPATS